MAPGRTSTFSCASIFIIYPNSLIRFGFRLAYLRDLQACFRNGRFCQKNLKDRESRKKNSSTYESSAVLLLLDSVLSMKKDKLVQCPAELMWVDVQTRFLIRDEQCPLLLLVV